SRLAVTIRRFRGVGSGERERPGVAARAGRDSRESCEREDRNFKPGGRISSVTVGVLCQLGRAWAAALRWEFLRRAEALSTGVGREEMASQCGYYVNRAAGWVGGTRIQTIFGVP